MPDLRPQPPGGATAHGGKPALPAPTPPAPTPPAPTGARRILIDGAASGRLTHVEQLPARPGRRVPWPDWVPADIVAAFGRLGIPGPWAHQAMAADHARAGRSVILSTGTASGKSVGYLAPALTAIGEGGTVLYLTPTRALAADQLRLVQALGRDPGADAGPGTGAGADRGRGSLRRLRPAVVDSDTSPVQRTWARRHATYLLTTPDMLHQGLLPQHQRWAGFFRRLRYVIVDECHGYRGVFGSHVAQVLRRLRRVAEQYREPGAPPLAFVLASATISQPATSAELLTGLPAQAVTADAAPRPPMTFALWEPPLVASPGGRGGPGGRVRRTAVAETAVLLADLVRDGVPSLAFVRSRRGAEATAAAARARLADMGAGHLGPRVAAYRSGYLPEERRYLESALAAGEITALAATSALELGVDIRGLDAVLIAGWPGTRAALWQRAGRAGRDGRHAVAILIARDDPLDTYLVHHPEALLHRPVESTVLDPANPYILAPHLLAAAAEFPLTPADLALFGPAAPLAVAGLAGQGRLRDRAGRWHVAGAHRAEPVSLRAAGGQPVRIVERATGRLIGTTDEPSAHVFAHGGAVYSHQGEIYLITELDLADGVALAEPGDPGYVTSARQVTEIKVAAELRRAVWGEATVRFGDAVVTRRVTSYTRRDPRTGKPLSEQPLDLPQRSLHTRAVWWTISPGQRAGLAGLGVDLAGAAHAAEHAAIGLLPLVAACDRRDVGGISADLHPSTGRLTIFVYDGHDGGAGFAERGFGAAAQWLRATSLAIADCQCPGGCPSCIQSPACGSGNEPLSKSGSQALLDILLARAPR